ncbi:E3 ubiquitin-protein ligase SH3RF1 isoform X3 [Ceratitis capitata]|uniref:E3 ubiquitin-protein ligase SH3RF1 isoform X3 n=1 Tax=Ceratitis capitata TaxID=7213 RepID=UPI000329C638|nr:E3 ubiquitin-protein ligase SH3RF1 isoform X3 [Ceratitis capitata]
MYRQVRLELLLSTKRPKKVEHTNICMCGNSIIFNTMGMKNAAAKTQQHQKPQASKSSPDIRNVGDPNQQQQQQLQINNHPHQLDHIQQRLQQHQLNAQPQVLQEQLTPTQVLPINITNSNVQQCTQQQLAQQRRFLLPHAYALYDFDSAEPSDLHFKKGDLVLLKGKIDSNWYVGQLNNGNGVVSEGTFPINHVQVIVPLPTPQCIALYDFRMPPNEEQGCLTFKKGTIINVLRRVDQNWAEGCIGNSIGIFPIAFVELNKLAKQVLEAPYMVANTSTISSTTPPTINMAPLTGTSNNVTHNLQQQLRKPPPRPQIDTANSDSIISSCSTSNSSSSATSPRSANTSTTTTTTSSNSDVVSGSSCVGGSSASMPSSPNQSLPASPQHEISNSNITSGSSSVRFRDKREKRHSLNTLLTASNLHIGIGSGTTLSILQSNRHSAEILSIPADIHNPTDSDVQPKPSISSGGCGQEAASVTGAAMPQSTVAREQQQQQQQIHAQQSQLKQQPQPQQRVNVLKTTVVQQYVPPSLPWGYLALYPYKPRKSDELELKKGCVYIVTERCLDGWFKGKNWQDTTGVFPGNYVTPLRSRDQQQLMHQWKYVPLQSTPYSNQVSTKAVTNAHGVPTQSIITSASQRIQSLHQPPELPPRQVSSTLPISSVWTKPLGHTVEAFFNRCKTNDNTKEHNSKEKETGRHMENVPGETVASSATSSGSSSTTSSAVQLMKRLAHIKSRSKSPSNTNTRQQQQKSPHAQVTANDKSALGDDPNHNKNKNVGVNNSHFNATNTHGHLHPVHVRSGSCPSQLLQNLPHDLTVSAASSTGSAAMAQIQENMSQNPQLVTQQQRHQHLQQPQHMQQTIPQTVGYGSQQLRGPKDRPHLPNARQSMDAVTLRSMYNSSVAQQQQQQSAYAAKCANEQQQLIPTNTIISNHRKSHSLDAAAALSSSSSDYATVGGSKTGGLAALVAPGNITAAAVAASATTKSTQSSRESRFRCIVPYPPNSEIELELQVGDIIYVQRRQKNGWYKGTHARTNKTGLFPASFVEQDI